MAFFSSIVGRRRQKTHAADLNWMSDRQLEDLGLCRADIRTSKPKLATIPIRAIESWPSR